DTPGGYGDSPHLGDGEPIAQVLTSRDLMTGVTPHRVSTASLLAGLASRARRPLPRPEPDGRAKDLGWHEPFRRCGAASGGGRRMYRPFAGAPAALCQIGASLGTAAAATGRAHRDPAARRPGAARGR